MSLKIIIMIIDGLLSFVSMLHESLMIASVDEIVLLGSAWHSQIMIVPLKLLSFTSR